MDNGLTNSSLLQDVCLAQSQKLVVIIFDGCIVFIQSGQLGSAASNRNEKTIYMISYVLSEINLGQTKPSLKVDLILKLSRM